jgi:hypothetical protein
MTYHKGHMNVTTMLDLVTLAQEAHVSINNFSGQRAV